MSETYCGKSCEACEYMTSGKCPGCSEGPGHSEYGACDLAKCCRDKGHEKCEACRFNLDCYLLKDKEFMPEEMAKRTKVELGRRDQIVKIAPFLAFWINILFWINFPTFFGGMLNNADLVGGRVEIALFGVILTFACNFIYGFILLKLAPAEKRYKLAGITFIASSAMSVVVLFIPTNSQMVIGLIEIIAMVVSLVSMYFEIFAHAEILRGVDNILGQKWIELWKWTVISMALSLVSGILVIAIAGLAELTLLAATMISLVVTVLKIKYLYDTSKVFKSQAVSEEK